MVAAVYSIHSPAVFLQKTQKFFVFHSYNIMRIMRIVKGKLGCGGIWGLLTFTAFLCYAVESEVNMANITITLDDNDKKRLNDFCDQIGLSVSALFTLFTKKVLREGEIPFRVGLDRPNRATIRAMKEGERLLKHLDKAKVYDNVEEMWEDLKK